MQEMLNTKKFGDIAFRDKDFKIAVDYYIKVCDFLSIELFMEFYGLVCLHKCVYNIYVDSVVTQPYALRVMFVYIVDKVQPRRQGSRRTSR